MKQLKKVINWRKYMAMALTATIIAGPMLPGTMVMAEQKNPVKSIKLSVENNAKVIVVGKKYNLSYKLTPSTQDKVTYTSSNTDVAIVSKGKLIPKKTGNVTITAKTSNGKKSIIKLLSVNKNGVTGWQSRIDKMLDADNITDITIKELALERNYIIKEGKYSKKVLTVNAPNSDVLNNGVFKNIVIQDVKDGTWTEYAKNNNIKVNDKDISMVIDKNASVKNLNFTAKNATINLQSEGKIAQVSVGGAESKINIVANGNVGKIVINSKADVVISGTSEKVQLEVTKNAEGAKVESAIKVEATVGSNVEVKLLPGAEGSTLEKSNADVKVNLNNETKSDVSVGTAGSDQKENVEAGKDNTTTTPGGSTGGSNNGTTTPSPTTITVTGNSSDAGKTATYVLPTAIDNLKSVIVKVNAGIKVEDYSVDGTILTYVKKLLDSSSTYINLWKGLTGFETQLSVGGSKVKIEKTDNDLTKTVTFDGMKFTVTVNEQDGSITVKKDNGASTYTLSKSGRDTLIIKSDSNTNVSGLVTFQVTY